MGLHGDDGFPLTWVARLVERNRAEFDLFHSLEVELAADGCEAASVDADGEVFSLGELRDQFAGLKVPAPGEYVDVDDFGGVDQFRLTCVFVLGVLGRWDEAFAHLGPFPGSFDRSDRSLLSARLDVVSAMLEDGRWGDAAEHGAALSFDAAMLTGDGSGLVVTVLVLRGEALARLGERVDALRLFRLALELGEGRDDVEDLVLESARDHEMFLVLGSGAPLG